MSDGVRRKNSWLVLSLGFGGLLVFVLAAAAGTLLALGRVRSEETHIRQAFLRRLDALDQIRSQIYLSGTYIRDFLLSPDPQSAAAQGARLAALGRDSHAALDKYAKTLESEEKWPFNSLRSEIEAYWQVLNGAEAWTPQERDQRRYAFFYDELIPRRTAMLQIADSIGAINERSLTRAEERLAASAEGLRRSLSLTFAVVLLGGLALAMMTINRTLRLERELGRRLEENARARADLEDLSSRLLRAQENERRTLARELHDGIGQSLSAILMEGGNAACAEDPVEIRNSLASITTLAEKTVNEVRDLALLLRPSMLDDLGLVPALNWYAREAAKRHGPHVVVTADEAANDLPDEHRTCIYRLAQEAVTNALRHASARTVEVNVTREPERVSLAVRDDGVGFDARFVRGLGLLGMEERVRRLGGQFRIDSQAGRGTLVSAELPLANLSRKNGNGAYSHSAG